MNCPVCSSPLKETSRFCPSCGTKIPAISSDKKFCVVCGESLPLDAKFCIKCGARVKRNSITGTKVINFIREKYDKLGAAKPYVSVVGVAVLILLIAYGVIFSINAFTALTSHSIVGSWTTDRGLDSIHFDFKENGQLIQHEFVDSSVSKYYVDGDELTIEKGSYEYTYYYSSNAKFGERKCWYIEDNVLYFMGYTLYKE